MVKIAMRNSVLWLLIIVCSIKAYAQRHISEIFEIDTNISLEYFTYSEHSQDIVGTIHDDIIYFCSKKIEVRPDSAVLRIFSVNLKNGQQNRTDIMLQKTAKEISTLWILGIAKSEKNIAIFEQNDIEIYDSAFTFVKQIPINNVELGYFNKSDLYLIQFSNHEKYVLYRFDMNDDSITHLRDFSFTAPFVTQFKPNHYIDVQTDGIYQLATDPIGYSHFSLSGEFIDRNAYTPQNWKKIPQKLTKKIMKYPYGTERLFYAIGKIVKRSYSTQIFPLSHQKTLITYHQYDTEMERESYNLCLLQSTENPAEPLFETFRFDYFDDETLSENKFPFYIYKQEALYTQTYGDKIIQILKEPDIDYNGLTNAEYRQKVQKYYLEKDPILKLRILKFIDEKHPNHLQKDTQDSVKHIVEGTNSPSKPLDRIRQNKCIVIVHSDLECSSCRNVLYNFVNRICDSLCQKNDIAIVVKFPECKDYLLQREKKKETQQQLTTDKCAITFSQYTRTNNDTDNSHYPMVLLYDERGNEITKYEAGDIFATDSHTNDIDKKFATSLIHFLENN